MVANTLNVLILAFVISAAHCRIRSTSDDSLILLAQIGELFDPNSNGSEVEPQSVTTDDVGLWFYSYKTGSEHALVVKSEYCQSWKDWGFDPNNHTVFLTHGWTHNGSSPTVQEPKDAFFKAGKGYNVVIVDWGSKSEGYLTALGCLEGIGKIVANVIQELVTQCGLDLKKVECVGHSLGAHVCGHTGAALDGKIGKICGLDPAAPLIGDKPEKRLDITDACYVEVIHTSCKGLSVKKAMGHADFYPCGATDQPGCDSEVPAQANTGACDHMKATTIYTDSILYPALFSADCECDSYQNALAKNCTNENVKAFMGHHEFSDQRGIFYCDLYDVYDIINRQ